MSTQAPIRIRAATAVLVCLALGCSSSTSLLGEWRDPSLTRGPYRKVLVLAMGPREDLRRTYEDAFVRELRQRGTVAIESYTLLPLPTEHVERDAVVKAVADSGADAVIVTRLLKMESRVVGGSPAYTPPTTSLYGYQAMGSYYRPVGYGDSALQAYPSMVATLETSLFDAATARVAWSGTTETFDADEAQRQIPGLVKTLITAMVKAKFIA
jgi:hypothetical protein